MKYILILFVLCPVLSVGMQQPNINEELITKSAYGTVEEVRKLLDAGASVHYVDYQGFNALLNAATHLNWRVIRLLLSRGADPNFEIPKISQFSATPLSLAVGKLSYLSPHEHHLNYQKNIATINSIKFLLDAGADINHEEVENMLVNDPMYPRSRRWLEAIQKADFPGSGKK